MVTHDQYWYFCHPNPPDTGVVHRTEEVTPGQTTRVEGIPQVGKWGLHGSKRLLDALMYTPHSASLALVTLGGKMDHGPKQTAATERTIVAVLPADETALMLRTFAAKAALQVGHLWEMPAVTQTFLNTLDPKWRVQAMNETEQVMSASRSHSQVAWDATMSAIWAILSWDPGAKTFSVVNVGHCVAKAASAKAWEATPARGAYRNKAQRWKSMHRIVVEEMNVDLERWARLALAQTQPAVEER